MQEHVTSLTFMLSTLHIFQRTCYAKNIFVLTFNSRTTPKQSVAIEMKYVTETITSVIRQCVRSDIGTFGSCLISECSTTSLETKHSIGYVNRIVALNNRRLKFIKSSSQQQFSNRSPKHSDKTVNNNILTCRITSESCQVSKFRLNLNLASKSIISKQNYIAYLSL